MTKRLRKKLTTSIFLVTYKKDDIIVEKVSRRRMKRAMRRQQIFNSMTNTRSYMMSYDSMELLQTKPRRS